MEKSYTPQISPDSRVRFRGEKLTPVTQDTVNNLYARLREHGITNAKHIRRKHVAVTFLQGAKSAPELRIKRIPGGIKIISGFYRYGLVISFTR